MKNIVRKIAIVLIISMTVGAITPAVNHAYSATALKYCYKNDAETKNVANLKIMIDEKAELKFVGAGDNWSSTFKGWKTSNPKIVTVTDEGVVTGVAIGTAQVWADLGSSYTGKVVVEVTEKKSYKIEQVSETIIKIDFKDTEVTENSLKDNLTFKYNIRENTSIKYPAKVLEVKNGIATVKLYAILKDGKKYTVSYNGIDGTFDAHIGKVDRIELNDNLKKVFIEKDDETCEVLVTPVLRNAYGVDITETALENSEAEIVYEVIDDGSETAQNSNITSDSENGSDALLTLARGTVTITATFYDGSERENDNGEVEKVVTVSAKKELTSKDRPEYQVEKRLAATISSETLGKDDVWDNNLSICVGDDKASGYGLKLQAYYADNSKAEKTLTSDPGILGTFRFESTDLDKLYVDRDGILYANNAGYEKGTKGTKVQVIVFYKPFDSESEEDIVDVIDVHVRPRRVATAATSTLLYSEGASYINGLGTYRDVQEDVETILEIKDQYGDHIDVDEFDVGNIQLETKCPEGVDRPTVSVDLFNGKYIIIFTGKSHSLPDGKKDGMEFKYKINIADGSKSFKLKTKSATLGHGTDPAGKTTYEMVWVNTASYDKHDRCLSGKFDCHVYVESTSAGYERTVGGKLNGYFVKKQNGVIVEDYYNIKTLNPLPNDMYKIDRDSVMQLLKKNEEDEIKSVESYYSNDDVIFVMEKKDSTPYNRFEDYEATAMIYVEFFGRDANNVYQYAENGGTGTYVYNIYKVVQKANAGAAGCHYELEQLNKKNETLEVFNTMKSVTGGERTGVIEVNAPVAHDEESFKEWKAEAVKECFKFAWFNGEKTIFFEKPEDYEGKDIKIEVKGNGPSIVESGDVYYIDEVYIYTSIGTNAERSNGILDENPVVYNLSETGKYFKSTVKINKYINVK